MSYKLIALDLDGTLTNSQKIITRPTKEALLDIQKQVFKLVLASGRPTPGMAGLADDLCLDRYGSYVLSYNGAKITDWRSKEVIFQKTLPLSVIPDLYKYAVEGGVGIISYENDNVVAGTPIDDYMMIESRINKLDIKYVENFPEYMNFRTNKCLMTGEHSVLQKVEERLKKKFKSLLSIYFSEPYFLEIMPQNVDKAQSLLTLLNTIGLTSEEMICCGDGFNDISMIEIAGLGVAMENAQEVVKAAADYITRSNDEDGILHVIQKFIMK